MSPLSPCLTQLVQGPRAGIPSREPSLCTHPCLPLPSLSPEGGNGDLLPWDPNVLGGRCAIMWNKCREHTVTCKVTETATPKCKEALDIFSQQCPEDVMSLPPPRNLIPSLPWRCSVQAARGGLLPLSVVGGAAPVWRCWKWKIWGNGNRVPCGEIEWVCC